MTATVPEESNGSVRQQTVNLAQRLQTGAEWDGEPHVDYTTATA